jgi:hypothetical protein
MRKLNLRPDTLHVESFPVADVPDEARGTVRAAEMLTVRTAQCGTCGGNTCAGATCFTSCAPGGHPACTCPIINTGE